MILRWSWCEDSVYKGNKLKVTGILPIHMKLREKNSCQKEPEHYMSGHSVLSWAPWVLLTQPFTCKKPTWSDMLEIKHLCRLHWVIKNEEDIVLLGDSIEASHTLIISTAFLMSRTPSYTRREASMNSFSSNGWGTLALRASMATSTCSAKRGITGWTKEMTVDQRALLLLFIIPVLGQS